MGLTDGCPFGALYAMPGRPSRYTLHLLSSSLELIHILHVSKFLRKKQEVLYNKSYPQRRLRQTNWNRREGGRDARLTRDAYGASVPATPGYLAHGLRRDQQSQYPITIIGLEGQKNRRRSWLRFDSGATRVVDSGQYDSAYGIWKRGKSQKGDMK